MDKYSIIMLIISFFWLLSEILINILTRSRKKDAKSHDRNSLSLIWIVIVLSIGIGMYIVFSFPNFSLTKYITGVFLMIIGICIRLIAVFSLKSFFTADVAIHHNHQLITDGIFTKVRHPSYSGSLLTFLGLGLMLGNWISLCVIFIPVLCVFLYRISIEEKALKSHFKDEYADYQNRTKKIIPYIY